MRIITDSAADSTNEELNRYQVDCVRTQVIMEDQCYTPGVDLSAEEFWEKLLGGANVRASQPSPQMFISAFEEALKNKEQAIYLGLSSALSGTIQSARLAASMIGSKGIHILDTLNGAAAQKLLILHACRLRDEGKCTAKEIVAQIESLRSRVRLLAGVDTLENLARSGRIPKAAASFGTPAKLKPLLEVSPEGCIVLCEHYPIIPFYSYDDENCCALVKKLTSLAVKISDEMKTSIGTAIAPHIGSGAYGVAFVEAE